MDFVKLRPMRKSPGAAYLAQVIRGHAEVAPSTVIELQLLSNGVPVASWLRDEPLLCEL